MIYFTAYPRNMDIRALCMKHSVHMQTADSQIAVQAPVHAGQLVPVSMYKTVEHSNNTRESNVLRLEEIACIIECKEWKENNV